MAYIQKKNFSTPLAFEAGWQGFTFSEDGRQYCEAHPAAVNSYGVWEKKIYSGSGMRFWEYPLPLLEITMLSTLVPWLLFDIMFKKLHVRIPKVASMMLAGVVLSQTRFMSKESVVHQIFFPRDLRPKVAGNLGAFGFTLFWFLKGVTIDVGMLRKTGARAGIIGVITMMVPLCFSYSVFSNRVTNGTDTMTARQYKIITFLESLSAFTGINMLFKDLKINHSEFGRIAQSSAMVTDLMASFVLILGFSPDKWWKQTASLRRPIFALTYTIAMTCVVRPLTVLVIKKTPEGRPVKDVYIYASLLLAYLSYHFARYMGLFGPIGPFLLGLTIPVGPPFGSALVQKFESFNLGIILPVYASQAMMQVDTKWLLQECKGLVHGRGQVYDILSFVLLVSSTKFLATLLSAFATEMPLRDSLVLALVLCNKGIFELAYYSTLLYTGKFGGMAFSVIATSILLNSLIVPIAIDFLYTPSKRFASYRKRNVLNLKHDSVLPALICIHKPDHIKSMIDILKAFRPSNASLLACYVIHLIELVGQATPTFVSHQLQKPEAGCMSRSNNVITSFTHLQQNFMGVMSIQMFTSICSTEHMHEDICWLALHNNLSIILLPFHRTWSLDRSKVISDDESIRKLNHNILKRAPCSVGVLVHRNPIWEPQISEAHCRVCLIFVGGKDDREALALTNRMRLVNPQISLTLLQFIPATTSLKEVEGCVQLFSTMDSNKIMKKTDGTNVRDYNSVKYIDQTVKEGKDTAIILRSMAFDYDLFIVGRGSGMNTAITRGIAEWIEFEELGAIGDLIASPDYPSRASVLVVQQQEYAARR